MPDLKQALVYTKPNGCKDASADPERIAAWWKEYRDANIGLATGEVNGIPVSDIDRNHSEGVDGEETLKEMERDLGPLPPTAEALTPNGGRHLYFKYPSVREIGIALKANGVEVIRTAKERLLLLPVPGRGWMGYQ